MPQQIAAIDLGSNSFHLVAAAVREGIQIVDRLKDPVRLAAGLDADRNLDEASQERALACLRRFGQRLAEVPCGSVRAVGTNALRQARNSEAFLVRAQQALGHRIEVVSGREEARLIYLGVGRDLEQQGPRLVVDIGGGSTELAVGEGADPLMVDSLYMGCVSWTMRFFSDGRVNEERMDAAVTAARMELSAVKRRYRGADWDVVLGSSGTIKAVDNLLRDNHLSPDGITPEGCARLRARVIRAGRIRDLYLQGLSETRREVLPGGLAVLIAVLEALRIEQMAASQGALREGLLVDLVGRLTDADTRTATVENQQRRYGVDHEQGERVAKTATAIATAVSDGWMLDERDVRLVGWAAGLHEVGTAIAFAGHHKHGAHMLEHAELPGFTRRDQRAISLIVRGHRGKFLPQDLAAQATLEDDGGRAVIRLALLLRVAACLHRTRSPRPRPVLNAAVEDDLLHLVFPEGYLADHPLTVMDLERTTNAFKRAGLALRYE
ncbi:MAG: Ppx/GppA family phosphatase [Proteobacteria bacterium]|nr:Ppx/GppA family phosphatase [Pseudomonadota bacterium]